MGPLETVTVVELAAIGPVPFASTLFADMGATVIRVDRREAVDLGLSRGDPKYDVLGRGRRSIALDIKSAAGRDIVLRLAESADALVEGFRPGVIERLGLGPDVLMARNPKLVVGRMTGFGQTGPLRDIAGHDIDYIALTGALHAIGSKGGAPVPPLNVVGDYGGGAMFLAFGVVAAILSARTTGRGQVVDAAMVDGAAYLMSMFYGLRSAGRWRDERGVNILDGGAPWYDVYQTKDGKWLAVGAIEQRFYAELIAGLGLADAGLPAPHDARRWPELRSHIARAIAGRTRDEWSAVFEDSDACVAPVLSLDEAPAHPHNLERRYLVERDGVVQPAPAPRFSQTPAALAAPPCALGADTGAILASLGFTAGEIAQMTDAGVVGPV